MLKRSFQLVSSKRGARDKSQKNPL